MIKHILLNTLLLFSLNIYSQHKITVDIKGMSGDTIILAHYLGESFKIIKKDVADNSGICIFKGDSNLLEGIYLIILPDKNSINFLLGKDQQLRITSNINRLEEQLEITESAESTDYLQLISIIQKKDSLVQLIRNELTSGYNREIIATLRYDLARLNPVVNNLKDTLMATYDKETLLGSYLLASIPPQMPQQEYEQELPDDSTLWYQNRKYYLTHYFDNIDLTDDRIARTPIIKRKFDDFFSNIHPEHYDTTLAYIDLIAKKMTKESQFYEFFILYLLDRYKNIEKPFNEKIYISVAEKYILKESVPWINIQAKNILAKLVIKNKPFILGEIAPPLIMSNMKSRLINLHSIKSEYTILLFYNYESELCRKAIEEVKIVSDMYASVINVMAVDISSNYENWYYNIKNMAKDWSHCYNRDQLKMADEYGVTAVPYIYILNKNKMIIGKRIEASKLLDFFMNEIK